MNNETFLKETQKMHIESYYEKDTDECTTRFF